MENAVTMLIVDDHPAFRAAARRLMESAGYRVVGEAEAAAQAVTSARELKPEVMLLDVQLPDGDGFDVAARLAADGSGPAIILTSSRDRSDYGAAIEQSGVCGFISKADLSGETVAALLK